jgi:DNA-binding MarR family transcriptional regulator
MVTKRTPGDQDEPRRGEEGGPRDEVAQALRAFGMERDRFEDAVARNHGITHTDLQALDNLSLHGALTPGQLGQRMLLTSGAITALADRLERLGWVTRESHPTDRRSTVLTLTDGAARAAEEIFGPYAEEMAEAASTLSKAERAGCRKFLARATEISERHARRQVGDDREGR